MCAALVVLGLDAAVKSWLYWADVFAFRLAAFREELMCFRWRPKVLAVITLLSPTLIISCLWGAITEASTSNSAELKQREEWGGEKCWKRYSSYLMCVKWGNEIFIFDGCRVEQSLKDRLKVEDNEESALCRRQTSSRVSGRTRLHSTVLTNQSLLRHVELNNHGRFGPVVRSESSLMYWSTRSLWQTIQLL